MLATATVILLWVSAPALGHRLDEYLQASTIDLRDDRVAVEVRMTPGIEVLGAVLAGIDTNGDGVISEPEQRAYGRRVLEDLSLTIDVKPARLRVVSSKFAPIDEMKEGLGEIVLAFEADVPRGGPSRRLVFENRHHKKIAAYLVNCLSPTNPDVRVVAQQRNYDQSHYQLDYTQAALRPAPLPSASWSTLRGWLGVDAAVVLGSIVLLGWRRSRTAAMYDRKTTL